MSHQAPRTDETLRARILLHALIGTLSISGAFILGESASAGERTGSLLLLLSGLLFVTVVVVDTVRALRSPATPDATEADHQRTDNPNPDRRLVTRRIRAPRAGPGPVTGWPDSKPHG